MTTTGLLLLLFRNRLTKEKIEFPDEQSKNTTEEFLDTTSSSLEVEVENVETTLTEPLPLGGVRKKSFDETEVTSRERERKVDNNNNKNETLFIIVIASTIQIQSWRCLSIMISYKL